MGRLLERVQRVWKGPDIGRLSTVAADADRHAPETAALALTSWEARALRDAWLALKADADVGGAVLRAVFAKCPDAQAVFGLRHAEPSRAAADYAVRRQASVIVDTIDMVVADLTGVGDGLRWPLVFVGEQHANYTNRGFRHEYWIVCGHALLELMDQQPMGRMKRIKRWKTLRVWRRFVYYVLSCLLTGYYMGENKAMKAAHNSSMKKRDSRILKRLAEAPDLDETVVSDEHRRPSNLPSQLLQMMALSVPIRV